MRKALPIVRNLVARRPVCINAGCTTAAWRLPLTACRRLSGRPTRPADPAPDRDPTLPETPCRTRFAPSPTGYLHLGSLRTALFNYLLAKSTNGQFILRVEDTDQTRLVEDAESRLYSDLKWAGLPWDEGPDVGGRCGPYRQSERLPLYEQHADRLVQEGKAYRCFCSPEDLEAHKRHAHEHGLPTAYPGTCLHISPEESEDRAARGDRYAVRFKSAARPVPVQDIVYKRFSKRDPEEDFIIRKRDGFPTYHFANVVDDHDMEITHVIRGAEWLISTPKHVELYSALGWRPPAFGHVGLLVNEDRQKLSKRHGGIDIETYRNEQILPPAVLNFAVLLGWNPRPSKGKAAEWKDVMTLEEMTQRFGFRFTKGDIVVTMGKLHYFQKKHTQRLLANIGSEPEKMPLIRERFIVPIANALQQAESARATNNHTTPLDPSLLGSLASPIGAGLRNLEEYVSRTLRASASVSSPWDFLEEHKYLFWRVPEHVLEQRHHDTPDVVLKLDSERQPVHQALARLGQSLRDEIPDADWAVAELKPLLVKLSGSVSFDHPPAAAPGKRYTFWDLTRWALLGGERGPAIADVMAVLGRDETLRRVELARNVARRDGEEGGPAAGAARAAPGGGAAGTHQGAGAPCPE